MATDTKQDLENKPFSTDSSDKTDVLSVDGSLKSEQAGVQRVEAAQKVWGKYTKWLLFFSLFLSAYVYSLDGYCAGSWNFRLTSAFGEHSLLTAISTAQAIIISLGKVLFAKWADVFGRPQGVALSLFFYVIGFIMLAAAPGVETAAGGFIFYALGYSGLQILIQVVIADTTTLRYRGLAVGLFAGPFLINFAVGPMIAAYFAPTITTSTTETGYPQILRWGYGMFCIIFPFALAPLIGTLWWGERKAVKMGYVVNQRLSGTNIFRKLWDFAEQLDIVGLLLLLAGLGLILEPTSLAGSTYAPIIAWSDAGILAPCYVIGALCWPALFFWEWKFATHPILPARVWSNRSLVGVLLWSFFDFVSFYLQYPYLASFIAVSTDWSAEGQNYFLYTQTVALTLFGILFGAWIAGFKRYKWAIFVGLCIRLIGVGTMIAARANPSSVAGLVMTQLLQGLGGGIASIGGTVAAQAAVPHQDTAIATAVPLLFAEIGNAVGNSIAGAIWRGRMPDILQENLGGLLNSTEIAAVYASAVTAATYPFGSPIRDAIIASYEDIMHTLLIAATVFAVPPLFAVLLLHNYETGNSQNAVESRNLEGERITLPEQNVHENQLNVVEQVKEAVPGLHSRSA